MTTLTQIILEKQTNALLHIAPNNGKVDIQTAQLALALAIQEAIDASTPPPRPPDIRLNNWIAEKGYEAYNPAADRGDDVDAMIQTVDTLLARKEREIERLTNELIALKHDYGNISKRNEQYQSTIDALRVWISASNPALAIQTADAELGKRAVNTIYDLQQSLGIVQLAYANLKEQLETTKEQHS